ncbi:Formate/nitrite transporter [Aureobasidium pullulans]|uniref:Formate/nitrite transporter n=1 Tax=Aureobasidium pullulans TaxID=5580 RepID=A0A4S9VI75_AURPU|nr:Formate/nitrite transporter [Aureobasidium pullulans]
MASVNGFSPQGIADLTTKAGIAKTRLTWGKLAVKSFFGGVFISLGGLVNLIVLAGSPGLRDSNPALAKLIAAFVFPMGFVLVTLTNMELCTSSLFVLPFTTLQRKTSVRATAKNLFVSYIGNVCGALFVAGVMAWWSNVLDTDTMTSYAVTQAEARVNVAWSVNFLRGIGCNFFVALAFFMSLGAVEYVSKICTIWVPIWAFVIAGYQHSIANYFMIPIGMFYGTNFGVGRFIYQSIIPVTLGNLVGGVVLGVLPFWYLYGRDGDNAEGAQTADEEAKTKKRRSRDSGNETVVGEGPAGYDRDGMTRAV